MERKFGTQLPQTKLTEANLIAIKYLYDIEGLGQNEIAALYGVHKSTICRILKGLRRLRRFSSLNSK